MAIRKSVEETIVVAGERDAWLERCEKGLASEKFKKIAVLNELGQVKANYKPFVGTLHGDILLTLIPEGPNTRIEIKATAAVDNVYAMGRSPGGKLIEKFKQGLLSVGADLTPAAAATPNPSAMSDELERLADLHSRGVLDDDEFKVAKSQLLGATESK